MRFRSGVVSGVRVSHRRASVEDIAAVSGDDHRTVVSGLRAREGVHEAFVLQTCNRAEAYVVTNDPARGRAVLADYVDDVAAVAVEMDHEESLEHLLRVACGLESLVLGEDQILGQVRTAYEDARGAGGIGPTLEEAVTKAIHVGERVRTETKINEGVVSLGSAAARVASRDVDLARATALVVGAGEMGTLAARALASHGVERLVVANRTVPHAEHLANEATDGTATDGRAVGLDRVARAAVDADVIVTATASDEVVLDAADLGTAGETTVVDLAQPRDVDPAARSRSNVTLHDLDTLESLTEQTRERRREAVTAVEAIIDDEFDNLLEQFKRKRADEVIAAMYESAARVKAREVDIALARLENEADGELTDAQREVIESLGDALVGQLLAAPTRSLRDAAAEDDWTTIHTALRLFDPEFGEDAAPSGFVEALLADEGIDASTVQDD